MPYTGPGIYEHFKGGHYRVWGRCVLEANGAVMIRYNSLSLDHELPRAEQDIESTLRPQTQADVAKSGIPDAFDDYVRAVPFGQRVEEGQDKLPPDTPAPRPRFRRIA